MSANFIARRYVFGSRTHGMGGIVSLLSVIGLSLGSGVLIAVLSVMNGFDKELRDTILTTIPHIRVLPPADLADWEQDSAFLAADEDIISSTPYAELLGLVRYRGEALPLLLNAIDPQQELDGGQIQRHLGSEIFHQLEQQQGLFLGKVLADSLSAEVGDRVTLIAPGGEAANFASLEVLGFFDTGTELDRRMALTSISTLQQIGLYDNSSLGISLYTHRVFDAYSHAYQILGLLPRGYRATTWAASHGNLFEAIQMSRYLVALIVFLLLGIAAFNVIASLMISSADRQADIAILKTLGAESGFLMKLFSLQGLLIGLIGAALGALLGVALSLSLTGLLGVVETVIGRPILQSNIYPLDYLPSELIWSQVALVSLVAVVLSTLGSVYPATRVLKVKPAETLRYE
ncbi:MAG: FtsX-like permease family protein [Porticoccaceae bacterium]|nr:FtsX-like permease family protein [Porticoccaceae bacterium]